MSEPSRDFAQQIRALRESQGLSVRALANQLGVSKVTVWKWEKGDSKPRRRLIAPLARALNVSPLQLHLPEDALGETLDLAGADGEERMDGGLPLQGEPLGEVIARAKRMIAEASGVGPRNITISIEY